MANAMLRRLTAFIALFAVGSAVDAQVDRGAFPSLAKRPVETRDRTLPPPLPVTLAPTDPALAGQVEQLARQASEADSAFQQQIAGSRNLVAAAQGATPASESWVAAQMAISVLDSVRYDSVAALAGLDTLHVERQNVDDASRAKADFATIDPARIRVLALVDAQNDALDALRSGLSRP